MTTDLKTIIKETLEKFCKEFIENPYLCYTEHGLHALFYTRLYNEFVKEMQKEPFADFKKDKIKQKVCLIQKEYPTASKLLQEKPRRQHWDIAIIKTPFKIVEGKENEFNAYDFFKLDTVIEFGLNASQKHLEGDIKRLSSKQANVENKFIVHFYRESESGKKFSRRDKSNCSRVPKVEPKAIQGKLKDKEITVYYALCDITMKNPKTYKITEDKIIDLSSSCANTSNKDSES